MAHSCRDRGLGDLCQSTHEFRHELGRLITVQDFWGTMLKYNAIQKGGNQSGYFPIRKCDDGEVPRGSVNESKSFAFFGQSFTLTLDVHGVSGSWGIIGLSSEQTMCFIPSSLVQLAHVAIGEELAGVLA